MIVLSSAIPGQPAIGEKGFSVIGGRPQITGDDANDPMDFLKIGAVNYTATNKISADTDYNTTSKFPIPVILKGVTSYNQYTWIVQQSYPSSRFWWLFAPNAKMTIWGS